MAEDSVRSAEELQAIEEGESRWKLALDAAGHGVWDWNIVTGAAVLSKRLKEMYGFTEEEVENHANSWFSRLHPDDTPRMQQQLSLYLDGTIPAYEVEVRVHCKDGSWKWILTRGMVVAREADGRPRRMIGTNTDISEIKRKEEDLKIAGLVYQAIGEAILVADRDQTIIAVNPDLAPCQLRHADRPAQPPPVSRPAGPGGAQGARSGQQVALLFIDLDRFKQVNDLLGHDAGDRCWPRRRTASKSCVRESDTVARLGGDEFTVILTAPERRPGSSMSARKSCTRWRALSRSARKCLHVGQHRRDALSERCDDVGRADPQGRPGDVRAKNAGKNQFSYFTYAMDEKAHLRLRLASELRSALPAGQLEVHSPAGAGPGQRPPREGRGAAALAPSAAWAGGADQLHSAGRGNRPDQPDRQLGIQGGGFTFAAVERAHLGGRLPDRRQQVADPVPGA
jgi:PAS domain S-box-containing protein